MKAAKAEKAKAKVAAKAKAKAAKKDKAKAKEAAMKKAPMKAKAMKKAPMKAAMKKVVKKLIEFIPGVMSILVAMIVGALSFCGAVLAVNSFRRSTSGSTKEPLLVD